MTCGDFQSLATRIAESSTGLESTVSEIVAIEKHFNSCKKCREWLQMMSRPIRDEAEMEMIVRRVAAKRMEVELARIKDGELR